jgi:hypothetical protein
VALVARSRAGAVVTLLVPAAGDAERLLLLSHVLDRLTNDTLPVAVTDPATGASLLAAVQCQVARGPDGFNVTLINNRGVTKQPALPPVVDPAAAVMVRLALRPGFGALAGATLPLVGGAALPLQPDGQSVLVTLPPGDMAIVTLALRAAEV